MNYIHSYIRNKVRTYVDITYLTVPQARTRRYGSSIKCRIYFISFYFKTILQIREFILTREMFFAKFLPLLALADEKPNIVFVLTDDLGWSNVGFHNPAILSTPFLDKMSKTEHAIELTNAYATHRCSPSRAAFLTGIYPFRYGLGASALKTMFSPLGLDTSLKLLPEHLREANYSTHMIGKWHLGLASEDALPHNRGFDTFYGMLGGQADYMKHEAVYNGQYTGRHVLVNNTGPVLNTGSYMGNDFTLKAMNLLNETDNQPRFLYMSYHAPHYPVKAPQYQFDFLQKQYKQRNQRATPLTLNFHGTVRKLDNNLKRMWETALKQERETIFVFTSDNGGSASWGGCNFPYRGVKGKFMEGGIKAVTLVLSTKRTFKKRQDNSLVHLIDWHPTILSLAKAPKVENLDGVDFSPLLENNEMTVRDRFIVGVRHYHNKAKKTWGMQYSVRYEKWKFYNYENYQETYRCDIQPKEYPVWIPSVSRSSATTDHYLKKLLHQSQSFEGRLKNRKDYREQNNMLYNLEDDPFELNNLAHQNLPEMKKIRTWAEKEIGTPKLAIVGAANTAYQNLIKIIVLGEKFDTLYMRVKGRKWEESLYDEYQIATGRLGWETACEQNDPNQCKEVLIEKSGWRESAIETDFEQLTEIYQRVKNKIVMAQILIEDLTEQCGEFCCPWRLQNDLLCHLDYDTNLFAGKSN